MSKAKRYESMERAYQQSLSAWRQRQTALWEESHARREPIRPRNVDGPAGKSFRQSHFDEQALRKEWDARPYQPKPRQAKPPRPATPSSAQPPPSVRDLTRQPRAAAAQTPRPATPPRIATIPRPSSVPRPPSGLPRPAPVPRPPGAAGNAATGVGIGLVVDLGMRVATGEPLTQAIGGTAAGAVGSLIGGAIGTALLGPGGGTYVGALAGGFLAGQLYNSVMRPRTAELPPEQTGPQRQFVPNFVGGQNPCVRYHVVQVHGRKNDPEYRARDIWHFLPGPIDVWIKPIPDPNFPNLSQIQVRHGVCDSAGRLTGYRTFPGGGDTSGKILYSVECIRVDGQPDTPSASRSGRQVPSGTTGRFAPPARNPGFIPASIPSASPANLPANQNYSPAAPAMPRAQPGGQLEPQTLAPALPQLAPPAPAPGFSPFNIPIPNPNRAGSPSHQPGIPLGLTIGAGARSPIPAPAPIILPPTPLSQRSQQPRIIPATATRTAPAPTPQPGEVSGEVDLSEISSRLSGLEGLLLPIFAPAGAIGSQTAPGLSQAAATGTCRTLQPGGCMRREFDGINNRFDNLDRALQGADLALLARIDDKLGPKMPGGISGGLGNLLDRLNERFNKLWNQLGMDRALAMLNLAASVHNAAMLTRDLGETLIFTLESVLQAVQGWIPGFLRNPDGEKLDLDLEQLFGSKIRELLISILGAEVYADLSTKWKRANRILSTVGNMLDAIRSMHNALIEGLEVIGSWLAKIGNTMISDGLLSDRSYPWMDETPQFKAHSHIGRYINQLENIEDAADSVQQLAEANIEFVESATELTREARALRNELDQKSGMKTTEEDTKTTESQSPDISPGDKLPTEPE